MRRGALRCWGWRGAQGNPLSEGRQRQEGKPEQRADALSLSSPLPCLIVPTEPVNSLIPWFARKMYESSTCRFLLPWLSSTCLGNFLKTFLANLAIKLLTDSVFTYRARKYGLQNLLSRTQAGPGRTAKQEQKQISPNHVQALFPSSVRATPALSQLRSKSARSK